MPEITISFPEDHPQKATINLMIKALCELGGEVEIIKYQPITNLGIRVLEAMIGLCELARKNRTDTPLTIGQIAQATNILVDDEVRKYGQAIWPGRLTPHKIGIIVRKQLRLRTKRSSQVGGAYIVIWDKKQIAVLQDSFGLDAKRLREIVRVVERKLLEL